MTYDELAEQVFAANIALPRNDLVAWTSGNASAIDRASGAVAIKPSGVLYDELTVESIVILDLDGTVLRGDLRPSVDTETHLHLYRQDPDIGAVIHTHSVYATAWAATGTPIPPCLTSIADNFNGPVPCGDYVEIGGDHTAREVLRVRGHSPAVLMQNHGVFCAAPTLKATLRAAIMVEEVAKTMIMAKIVGTPIELPADEVQRQYRFSLVAGGQG
ncbi:class II aldolase/adducin family protein [Nakamurella lactea]|uniref:class II aldolase/adducin family protein n=1 Tax=Nakamurella lactea TaxID=459515 RepID=UPI00040C8349|nr:class II aldolase/adducin family protein [Nakamurella lactea]